MGAATASDRTRARILGGLIVTATAVALSACAGLGGGDDDRGVPNVIGDARTTTAASTVVTTVPAKPPPKASPRPSLRRLVGQKLMVAYRESTVPPPRLLQRIRRGEVGGVILFTDNVPPTGASGVRRVVAQLQEAARAGGNPRLLIATDQEGGDVKRMPGPPDRSPRELGSAPLASVRAVGAATGRSLRAMGIGVDLAPVADVPTDAKSFLGTRAFGSSAQPRVGTALAFARGLQRAGVAATAKHYPGLGSSGARNTDMAAVTLATPRATLQRERAAFLRQVRAGTRLIMMSNATYAAYDPDRPAVTSRKIIGRLRRDGFRGVVISDELRVPGLARFGPQRASAATRAGVDVVLFANGDGEAEYRALLSDVGAGRVRRQLVERQVRRIAALKHWISAGGSP